MRTFQLKDFLKHVANISTISPVAVELINKISLPNTTRREIADLIEKDEVLYASVFQYVSSATFYGRRRPANVLEAVALLGTNEIRNLVFSIAARKSFVDLDLWFRSVFTACTAEQFSRILNYSFADVGNIYIVGLMQAIGEQVFSVFYKREYEKVLKAKTYAEKLRLQKEVFGISSIELSCEIIKELKLPESVIATMERQKLNIEDEHFTEENSLVYLAASIAELSPEKIAKGNIIDAIDQEVYDRFDLARLEITPILIEDLLAQTKAFVNL
jgi:HD-like signal output (HDOD) protein